MMPSVLGASAKEQLSLHTAEEACLKFASGLEGYRTKFSVEAFQLPEARRLVNSTTWTMQCNSCLGRICFLDRVSKMEHQKDLH